MKIVAEPHKSPGMPPGTAPAVLLVTALADEIASEAAVCDCGGKPVDAPRARGGRTR